MIYGHPSVRIEDDQTDRIGLRTVVLSLLWQPSRWPLNLFDLDAEKPAPPGVAGGLLLIGEQTRTERGAVRTFWTFEGISGNGNNVTFKDRAHSLDYWFEPAFSERSLLRHPKIQDLLNQYGGTEQDGQIQWQPTMSKKSGNNGASADSQGDSKPNPLYGYQSYFGIEGTYHFRYAVVDLSQIPNVGGKVFSNSEMLPGRAPHYSVIQNNDGTPTGRNWLGMAPAPRRVGPVYEVVETYWLSGDGGWPGPIYNPSSGSGGGGGLTTGSLTSGSL